MPKSRQIKPFEVELIYNTPSVWSHLKPHSHSVYKATTSAGTSILFWKAGPLSPTSKKKQKQQGIDTSYACHGATIGSDKWPQGPLTPYGNCIDTLLHEYFTPLDESKLLPGDVVAWRDEDGDISHTARLRYIYRDEQGLLGKTRLSSKNGAMVFRELVRLETLNRVYGTDTIYFREKVSINETISISP